MPDVEKVLETVKQAIAIEQFGYDFYNSMRSFVGSPDGQKFVSYLARLEVDHIKWLEEEYERQLAKLKELREGKELDLTLLGKEEIFLAQDKLPDIFKDFDPVKAVSFAMDIEKKSVDFYEKNMEIVDDDALKDLFKRLADFERDHIIVLNNNLQSLQTKGIWEVP